MHNSINEDPEQDVSEQAADKGVVDEKSLAEEEAAPVELGLDLPHESLNGSWSITVQHTCTNTEST